MYLCLGLSMLPLSMIHVFLLDFRNVTYIVLYFGFHFIFTHIIVLLSDSAYIFLSRCSNTVFEQ
jgi:hypothetical protein